MPRGGRWRGGGGGRGPRSRPGTARIGGQDIAYDDELAPALQDRPQPTPLYPEYRITPPKPLTNEERAQVACLLAVRNRIRDGPLYATGPFADRVGVRKRSAAAAATAAAHFDPFEGVERYSDRHTKKAQRLPRIEAIRYSARCFPKELQAVLQRPKARVTATALPKRPQAKIQNGAKGKVVNTIEHLEEEEDTPAEPVDPDEAPEEEVDDKYATEEDEEGADDYNAEQYFDDGADEGGGDDYDGGGGGDDEL